MRGTEVFVDKRSKTRGGTFERVGHGLVHRADDQILTGLEMILESTVRESGFLHQIRNRQALKPRLPKSPGCNIKDARPVLGLLVF